MTYCAAGTSLDKFIRAYDIEENKGFFPYEWLDSYDKLNYLVQDLNPEHFYSELKGKSISQEDYDYVMRTCKENGIVYIRDLLE